MNRRHALKNIKTTKRGIEIWKPIERRHLSKLGEEWEREEKRKGREGERKRGERKRGERGSEGKIQGRKGEREKEREGEGGEEDSILN